MPPDLGGDDLKCVSYRITFVKPDFEATLQPAQEDIVDYPTNETAFAGRKVAEFFDRLRTEGIPWPSAWKESPGDGYPESASRSGPSRAGSEIRQVGSEDTLAATGPEHNRAAGRRKAGRTRRCTGPLFNTSFPDRVVHRTAG